MNIAEFSKEFGNKILLDGDEKQTARIYTGIMAQFMIHYEKKYTSPLKINTKDIENYILYLVEKNMSKSYINQFIAASKRFYKIFGQLKKCENINYHPKELKTPNVLTFDECLKMCNANIYIKHRAIINLLYWGALRRNEIINLKIEHLSKDRRITIIGSKFRKSRVITIPQHVLELLRTYYLKCKPKIYLFNGEGVRLQYSAKSIENIIKNTSRLCGIKKRTHPHIMRSSRATHLLDNGASDMYVSEFLGHEKVQTTKDYYCKLTLNGMQNNFDEVDYKLMRTKSQFVSLPEHTEQPLLRAS